MWLGQGCGGREVIWVPLPVRWDPRQVLEPEASHLQNKNMTTGSIEDPEMTVSQFR